MSSRRELWVEDYVQYWRYPKTDEEFANYLRDAWNEGAECTVCKDHGILEKREWANKVILEALDLCEQDTLARIQLTPQLERLYNLLNERKM